MGYCFYFLCLFWVLLNLCVFGLLVKSFFRVLLGAEKIAFEFLCGCKDCDHQTRKVKDLSLIPYYFDEVKKWYDGVKALSFDLVEMWV